MIYSGHGLSWRRSKFTLHWIMLKAKKTKTFRMDEKSTRGLGLEQVDNNVHGVVMV